MLSDVSNASDRTIRTGPGLSWMTSEWTAPERGAQVVLVVKRVIDQHNVFRWI